jgi:hypothetical protein
MTVYADGSGTAIVIVGDWLVDEFWFLVRHRSELRARDTAVHHRVCSNKTEIVRGVGGAGRIFRIFNERGNEEPAPPLIIGLGNWHQQDEHYIRHLLHCGTGSSCHAGCASFQLSPVCCDNTPEFKIFSVNPTGPTIRVVRQFHQEEQGLRQMNRIDWDPGDSEGDDSNLKEALDKLKDSVQGREVSAIVVLDFRKGAVSQPLIEALHEQWKGARWYVRSNSDKPSWLATINQNLSLFIIGPSVSAGLNPFERWLHNGRITFQAKNALDKAVGKNVVLVSDDRQVVALLNERSKCVTGISSVSNTFAQFGWATAFFGWLVKQIHSLNDEIQAEHISSAIDYADNCAYVKAPTTMSDNIRANQESILRTGLVSIRPTDWAIEKKEWEEATNLYGVIKDGAALRLEVWRACSHLHGYVACIGKKQETITNLGHKLRSFAHGGSSKRSLSILLQADPGSGKSTLAKCLADAFGFKLLRFDLTQMAGREEVRAIFDAIATEQANDKEQKILVFVDEINALLGAAQGYGPFLAPLEEGIYLRNGRFFSLMPCAWIFAGTKLDEDPLKHAEKMSDFKSRMSAIALIDYPSIKAAYGEDNVTTLNQQAKLEQVYLGAMMIRAQFSDVQQVSLEILKHFHHFHPDKTPAREIRRAVSSLRNVRYGKITRENCPDLSSRVPEASDFDKLLVTLIFD